MAKGSKICPSCNASVGPRSFACKHCKHVFDFKNGYKPTEKDIKRVSERVAIAEGKESVSTPEEEEVFYKDVSESFNIVTPTKDELVKFGQSVKTYESKCGKYRLRAYNNFYGVPACNLYDEANIHPTVYFYQLCKYQRCNSLALVKRFKSSSVAVGYYQDVVNGVREDKLYTPSELNRETRGMKNLKKRRKGKKCK